MATFEALGEEIVKPMLGHAHMPAIDAFAQIGFKACSGHQNMRNVLVELAKHLVAKDQPVILIPQAEHLAELFNGGFQPLPRAGDLIAGAHQLGGVIGSSTIALELPEFVIERDAGRPDPFPLPVDAHGIDKVAKGATGHHVGEVSLPAIAALGNIAEMATFEADKLIN